jgi:DNA-binding transcriptional regulator LsrR (DeoR family)
LQRKKIILKNAEFIRSEAAMNERDDLLAMVASLYYKLNQGQAEIAERLGVSTSKVSRLLKEARHHRGADQDADPA